MAAISPGNFNQPMTHINALFTVTVFSTAGFGDVTAKTEAARLVVTGQMMADIVILGLGVRVIVGAVKGTRQRRTQDACRFARGMASGYQVHRTDRGPR
jgi:voltage-gated potassium channel